jgi:hypothetical protein
VREIEREGGLLLTERELETGRAEETRMDQLA